MQPADNKKAKQFSKKVGEKAQRKLKALHNDKRDVWFGLDMMGIVGWTIVVPTLLGAALGVWLDKNYPQSNSWTLTGLVLGLFAGCLIAWRWVNKEHKEINRNDDDE
ncbi:MAG: AtpZ/AtpI family protein [Bacteroidales bacterium]|nr:AtpZ/AtpI family protein [Bacteroidales bacterium]